MIFARYAPVLFGMILSGVMSGLKSGIMSGIATARAPALIDSFLLQQALS